MLSKIYNLLNKIGFVSIFLLLGYFSNIFNKSFLFGYILLVVILLNTKFIKLNLDKNLLVIFLFGLCYGLFYSLNSVSGFQYVIIYMFSAATLYLWGKFTVFKLNSKEHFIYLLIFTGIALSSSSLISVVLDIIKGGFAQANRNIPMFWSTTIINATGMAAPFILNMCIPALLATYHSKFSTLFKVFLSVIYMLTTASSLRLGSRTQLAITLITLTLTIIYLFKKQNLKSNLTLSLILFLGILLTLNFVSFDLNSDIMTSFATRMESGGAADIASGGGRTERWVKSIEYIFEKPLGWDVSDFGFSHNLWFDTLRAGSVISFVLLISVTISAFFSIKKTMLIDSSKKSDFIILGTYFIAFYLIFFVEPIIDGNYHVFTTFCFFWGATTKHRDLYLLK